MYIVNLEQQSYNQETNIKRTYLFFQNICPTENVTIKQFSFLIIDFKNFSCVQEMFFVILSNSFFACCVFETFRYVIEGFFLKLFR